MTTEAAVRCLIVIPCLNESRHIGALLAQFLPVSERLNARIVVVDGGSSDDTRRIVRRSVRKESRVVLLENPKRIQSAAVNLAVERFGQGVDYMIRIDAHGQYPDDYCERLVEEAEAMKADSVVVSMRTSGAGAVQMSAAAAQNSRLGTGGSRHRHASFGGWVDHGHHALMRVSAFQAVGGYDETFSHNEDAELDHRLRKAGYRIWMSGRTHMVYFPRASLSGLYLQYLNYGRGRARNVLKHRAIPKLRQIVPLMVFPVVLLAGLSFASAVAALPLAIWIAVCLVYGICLAVKQRNALLLLAGVSAMVMHFAWSTGFWLQIARSRVQQEVNS